MIKHVGDKSAGLMDYLTTPPASMGTWIDAGGASRMAILGDFEVSISLPYEPGECGDRPFKP
jgi:hypothetical protein